MQCHFFLLFLLVLLPTTILFLTLGILFLESHEVAFEEIVLPPHVLDVLEVTLQLLRQLFNSQQLLTLLGGLQLPL